jgi:hypothetical protein
MCAGRPTGALPVRAAQENDSQHHNPNKKDDDVDALPEPDPRRRQVRSHPRRVRGRQGADARRVTIVAIE